MGRPAYTVKDKVDYRIIKDAIEYYQEIGDINALHGRPAWLKIRSPNALQEWIDEYLDDNTWAKIKRNLPKWRQRRSTDQRTRQKYTSITLKTETVELLQALKEKAKQRHPDHEFSYDEVLMTYLEPLLYGGRVIDHNGKPVYMTVS